jgi:hypothetical protein
MGRVSFHLSGYRHTVGEGGRVYTKDKETNIHATLSAANYTIKERLLPRL